MKDINSIKKDRANHIKLKRAELKLAGMCYNCRKKPAENGRVRCHECNEKANRQHYNRRKNRVDAGLCGICGIRKHVDNRNECQECLDKYNKMAQLNYRKLKTEVFNQYGGCKCANCGETEMVCLSIDHVDGGGCKHRKETGCGSAFYYWLRDSGFPPGYRVLCMNCQFRAKEGLI